MNGFPGDSDQSPGIGRGTQIVKNNVTSDRAKFASDDLVINKEDRVKLLLEKMQDSRKVNRVTKGNEARHQVLERLRAANKNKIKNEETTDSGICSSPNQGSANMSMSTSQDKTKKLTPSVEPEVIDCFSSDEEDGSLNMPMPSSQDTTKKSTPSDEDTPPPLALVQNVSFKPTNFVMDQFVPPNFYSSPNSSEVHNMNSFLKSGSTSSSGERPNQSGPYYNSTKREQPKNSHHMQQENRPPRENEVKPQNEPHVNSVSGSSSSSGERQNQGGQTRNHREQPKNEGTHHMQQENRPPRDNGFKSQNEHHSGLIRASVPSNHPLFPPHGFTAPPPTIKNEIPSFFHDVSQDRGLLRNTSQEPDPKYSSQNKNDVRNTRHFPQNKNNFRSTSQESAPNYSQQNMNNFRNTSQESAPKFPPQNRNDIPSFFRNAPPQQNKNDIPTFFRPQEHAQQNNSSIPSFFHAQNSNHTNDKEGSKKGPPASLPPSLSDYMSKNMNNRHYSQADAIEAVSRLCDYKLPPKNKISGLNKLMQSDIFNSKLAIQILNTDGGDIVHGIRKMIENYRQKPDDPESRPVLILSLKVLNKCLDFSATDPRVKSYVVGLAKTMSSEKGEQTSLTFLQQLLKMCDPRGGVFSEEYTDQLCQELLELEEGNILGTTQMSADKPEHIVDAFKQCLGITLGVSDSSLVKNIPEQYRIVSLKLENTENGTDVKLADFLLGDDVKNDPRNVWAVNHTTKMSSEKIGNVNVNTTAIVFVTLFPTGHFLAYTDTLYNITRELDDIDRNLNMPPHCVQPVQDLRLGMMVCVKRKELKKKSRRPFRPFQMARALVMDIFEDHGKVAVYLIDYGITGEVSIDSLSPPPKDLIPIPPRLTFCRLQGVGPAPKTGLLRECIRAISRLSTTSSVTTLVNRPTLEAGRILSQLLGSGEEVIQMAALSTLSTVAGTPLGSKWLVRAKDEMVPCAAELVCPAVICFLREGRENRSRWNIVMCLEILKNLLDQLKPDHMRSVFENSPLMELLYSLKHMKDVMATHENVIKTLCEMQTKGNSYNPDVQINSLRRREILEKNKRTKYVPGSKPAIAGGELARIVGGQRKEEMQPLIFKNTDVRQREQTPRQESQERVEGPINPYNPHKVVSASGPVWANAGDLSNHHLANQALDESTQYRNIDRQREASVSDRDEGRRSSTPPDNVRRDERDGSSNRNFTSAAVTDDNVSTLGYGQILQDKHGAKVELWAPNNRNDIYLPDICKSHLSTLICGFLNSLRGGSVYIGVKQNGYILGIKLSRQEKDQFRQTLDRILASMISPRVPPNTVDIDFHRAEDRTRPALESYVIRITIDGRSTGADEKVYMAHNLINPAVKEGMYLRGANGHNEKLNQSEIIQELKRQTEKMHKKKMLASEMGKLKI